MSSLETREMEACVILESSFVEVKIHALFMPVNLQLLLPRCVLHVFWACFYIHINLITYLVWVWIIADISKIDYESFLT